MTGKREADTIADQNAKKPLLPKKPPRPETEVPPIAPKAGPNAPEPTPTP